MSTNNITNSTRHMLCAIRDGGERITNSDLQTHLNMPRSTVEHHIRRLEIHKLIKRNGKRGNARRMWLTPEGEACVKQWASSPAYRSWTVSKPKMTYRGKTKKRPCLMCGEQFTSQGSGERVCASCKGTKAWKSGEFADYSVRLR